MAIIEEIEVKVIKSELRETFKTALREVVSLAIVRVTINGNFSGDAVETRAITGDTLQKIQSDLQSVAASSLLGREFGNTESGFQSLIEPLNICRSAKAALDMAFTDLCGELNEGGAVRTDVTVPITPLSELENVVHSRIIAGFTSFKIKLHDEPLALLIEKMKVIDSVTPTGAQLRVDPNQSWSSEGSIEFLSEMERSGIAIEYLEQPTTARDFDALAKVKEGTNTKIMADESCFTEADLLDLIHRGAIDIVNLKILKNAGVTPVLQMAALAKENGISVSIGSMMESELGVTYAARLARKIAPEYVHDLDAAWWLKESSLVYHDGFVSEK